MCCNVKLPAMRIDRASAIRQVESRVFSGSIFKVSGGLDRMIAEGEIKIGIGIAGNAGNAGRERSKHRNGRSCRLEAGRQCQHEQRVAGAPAWEYEIEGSRARADVQGYRRRSRSQR